MNRFFDVMAFLLVLVALLGPVGTYAAWKQQTLVHKVHTEGIETEAEIVGGMASKYKGAVGYTLDLKWTLKSGAQFSHSAGASGGYGAGFFSTADPFGPSGFVLPGSFRITAGTVPIKYLEADPSSVILHLDPANSEQNRAGQTIRVAVVSAVGIAGTLLLFLLGYLLPPPGWGREIAQTALSPGELRRWIVWSLLLYAPLAGIHFIPQVHSFDVRYFGAEPYGIPVTLAAIAATTILYLPIIWVLRQQIRIDGQRRRDESWVPGIIYLLAGGWHRHLLGSAAAIWLGGLYIFAIGAAMLFHIANAPAPTGIATVDSIHINKAFPGAARIAERLVQAGLPFDGGEDWFGPKDPGRWTVEIGAGVDVKVAQQIIAICTEESRGNIFISVMADKAAYKALTQVHIGGMFVSNLGRAANNIQPMLKPGISAEELHRIIMQQ